jgi:hypothetical protein
MNKRIRELVEEAGLLADDDAIERFAELIIDECELVVDCDNMYAIKEHFGDKDKI